MSGKMHKVNRIVMFALFLLLLETLFVRIFLLRPQNTEQFTVTIAFLLILGLAIGALYVYEKRNNEKIVALTFTLLSLPLIAIGVQSTITSGSFITKEGAVVKVQGGTIILGLFFLIYALVVWLSKQR
ncbi:MAG TPA: hypothetical protein EYP52_10810 [Anaerolineae bacterium]|nr:hypothetical protein [Anaerolineae bacterium]